MTDKNDPKGIKVDGKAQAAELLSGLDPEHREKLLTNIAKENPQLAEELRSKMHGFEDLLSFEDGVLQTLLRDIPVMRLALCMRACSDELKTKILSNLSSRMKEALEEEIQSMGPQPLSKVRETQQEIVDKLEEAGHFDR